jgi:hypothetical protein
MIFPSIAIKQNQLFDPIGHYIVNPLWNTYLLGCHQAISVSGAPSACNTSDTMLEELWCDRRGGGDDVIMMKRAENNDVTRYIA